MRAWGSGWIFAFCWGLGGGGSGGGRCVWVGVWAGLAAAPPPPVHAAMRRFAMKNLQPNHVPYCASPLKRAAFRGAAESGAEQIIISYFDIIITSLEDHYYTFLHHFYIYYYPFCSYYYPFFDYYYWLLRHYYVIITSLLRHYYVIITSLLRHYYVIITVIMDPLLL